MRADRPSDRWYSLAVGGGIVAAGAGLGAVLGAQGSLAGGGIGFAAAFLLHHRLTRRASRRRQALARPFPDRDRRFLEDHYDHYLRLPPERRLLFEDDLRLFLSETRITGIGVPVTEDLRLLVAASAVTLSLGWPDFEWDHLAEVLLYPEDFDRDYQFEDQELSGQAHPWGTVILSVPSLLESFDDPDDGYHVGIHEFAHLLDVDQTQFDGTPTGLDGARGAQWPALVEKEMERLRRGKSVLDPYGAEDAVEFLAVAVEAFFEMPLAVRKRHRELYEILSAYFGQDPAGWDDARGLTLP